MKLHTTAAITGLAVGFALGLPWTMAAVGLALPCYLLWVVIIEGPDPAAREAAEWRGNWRQMLKDAEPQNNIRRGPRA